MIQFSQNIQTAMSREYLENFYMVSIKDVNNVYKLQTTSFSRNITLSNGEVYYSDGYLVAVDPPQMTSVIDREAYNITIYDPIIDQSSLNVNSLIGMVVLVRLGFVDITTNQPYINISDTLIVYKGRVDTFGIKRSTSEIGESLLQIGCSSPMRNLDVKRPFHLTKDNIRKRDPDDACCDQLYEGSGALTFRWGKK